MMTKIVEAKGVYKLFLKTFGYGAITMPWKTVHMLSDRLQDEKLVAHEMVHIEQIEREGGLVFTLKYLWYNIKYGYASNPYEIEAREKSGVW